MKRNVSIVKSIEVLGGLGLIASLIFVAYEIRQNTIAARASAFQQLGIATAEMWGEISRDPAQLRIYFDRSDVHLSEWSADDWARTLVQMTAWSRLAETGLIQVREGLLPPSSLELLGYSSTRHWLQDPATSCLWKHRLRANVSEDFASLVESGPDPVVVDCAIFPSYPFMSATSYPNTSDSN